jgi:hypothetical protein
MARRTREASSDNDNTFASIVHAQSSDPAGAVTVSQELYNVARTDGMDSGGEIYPERQVMQEGDARQQESARLVLARLHDAASA